MKKIVKEYINEKFTEDGDPIQDMGIGQRHIIEKWLKETGLSELNLKIRSDGKIDVFQDCNLENYFHRGPIMITKLPDFIKFNIIHGNFIAPVFFNSMKGFPKHIKGNLQFGHNKLKSLSYMPKTVEGHVYLRGFSTEEIREKSRVGGNILNQ